MMTSSWRSENLRTCDIDMQFCEIQVDCENCPMYMNDCDGDPEKLDDYDR